MKKFSILSLALLAILGATIAFNNAYAQTLTLTNNQTVAVVIIGTLGGVVVAYQSLEGKPFDVRVFINTILHSAIATIPIALASAVTQTSLGLLGLTLVFFASIGVTVTLGNIRGTPVVSTAIAPQKPTQ